MPAPKKDFDKADEGTQEAEPFAGFELKRRADAPVFPKVARKDQDEKDNPRVSSSRITGAYQLGGVWYAEDGSPLTAPETQQAHRAADRAAAEARRRALLGGNS